MNKQTDIRVQVAQDVLAQIVAKKLFAKSGTYLEIYDVIGEADEQFNAAFSKSVNGKCTVCAVGALFVGLIDVQNHCTVEEMGFVSDDTIANGLANHPRLVEVFGEEMMSSIEGAFEGWHEYENFRKEHGLGQRNSDDEKTLIAIMHNIVENGGTFKP